MNLFLFAYVSSTCDELLRRHPTCSSPSPASLQNGKEQRQMRIGIYGVSSQSGAAYFADLVQEGALVYGYARPSEHGRTTVRAIREQGGMQVDRPENEQNEKSHFVPLLGSEVGHDIERLATSDLILFAHPSVYH